MSTSREKQLRFLPRVEGLEERVTPSAQLSAFATGGGQAPVVRVFGVNNAPVAFLTPTIFGPAAELRVATGDVNGDGFDDVVVAGGRDTIPGVLVYLGSGNNFQTTAVDNQFDAAFLAFGAGTAGFTGGVNVAVGEVDPTNTNNGLAREEIIVSPASQAVPLLLIYRTNVNSSFNINPNPITTELAGPTSGPNVGVSIDAGDFNGDGLDEIVALQPGTTTAFIFKNLTPSINSNFYGGFRMGLGGFVTLTPPINTLVPSATVSAGDLDDDGFDDLLVGTSAVNPFSGALAFLTTPFGNPQPDPQLGNVVKQPVVLDFEEFLNTSNALDTGADITVNADAPNLQVFLGQSDPTQSNSPSPIADLDLVAQFFDVFFTMNPATPFSLGFFGGTFVG